MTRTFHKVQGLREGEILPENWKPTLYFVDMKNIITAVFTDMDRLECQEQEYNDNNLQGVLFL